MPMVLIAFITKFQMYQMPKVQNIYISANGTECLSYLMLMYYSIKIVWYLMPESTEGIW